MVGAGISMNAGVPCANCMIQILKGRYRKRFKKNKDYSYAEAFNAALPGRKHQAERRSFIEGLFAGKSPTEEHYLIAQLAEHRKFSIVLSTNFDHLLETAMSTYCSLRVRIYLYDTGLEPQEYTDKFPKILKLHGDFLFDDLANLEDEIKKRLTENMRNKLNSYLQGRGLVVVGYSGSDNSVTGYLKEVARTPRGLQNGLWLVTMNLSEAEIRSKENKNQKIVELIDEVRRQGKKARIIAATNAVSFFKTLCHSLDLSLPKPAPFGISSKHTNPLDTYLGRFGRARQFPPLYDITRPNNLSKVISNLGKALEIPGIIWLVGTPGSGKTTAIGKLFIQIKGRRLFYFSHRFAQAPSHFALNVDLESFASAIGVPLSGCLCRKDYLKLLFEKGAILILDDLFPETIPISKWYWEYILDIIAVQSIVNKGNVILVSFRLPPENALVDIYHRIFREKHQEDETLFISQSGVQTFAPPFLGPEGQLERSIKYFSSWGMTSIWPRNKCLSPDDIGISVIQVPFSQTRKSFKGSAKRVYDERCPNLKKVLRVMSLLRFAEYPDVLKQLVQISHIQGVLEELVEKGLAEERRTKYILLDSVQNFLRRYDPTIKRERSKVAQRFKEISLARQFENMPYVLEAENHYWMANDFLKALECYLRFGDFLIAHGAGEIVYNDFLDFLGVKKGKFISSCKPHLRFRFWVLLYKAQQTIGLPYPRCETEYKYAIDKIIMPRLGKIWRELFFGEFELVNNRSREAIEHFSKAENILAGKPPSHKLGSVQLDLSYCFNLLRGFHAEENQEYSKKQFFWARKAKRTFSRIKNKKGIAMANDTMAGALYEMGEYKKALELSLESRDIFSTDPGLSPDKGAVYGNLFLFYLYLGNIEEAEGCFFESNLNYGYVGNWEGIEKNFINLLYFACTKEVKGKVKGKLPSPLVLYRCIVNLLKQKTGTPSFQSMDSLKQLLKKHKGLD